jgi:dihydrofolate reductase
MKLSIIVAASENNVIGKDNQLLWRLPDDLKFFKAVTTGKPIIMGRKTFESIGGALPNRLNVVLSSDSNYKVPNEVMLFSSAQHVIEFLEKSYDEAMVIGGQQIYNLFMPFAQKLYLTRVHVEIEGDTFFTFDQQEWVAVKEEFHPADEKHALAFTFIEYVRKDF